MRRSELLDYRALGSRRAGVGAGESSITHEITPRWIKRFLADDDFTEQLARFVSLVVVGPIVAVLVGPGLGIGAVLYRGLERLSPRIGRLWVWPWIVLSALVLLITGGIGWLTGPRLGLIPWFPMVWTTLPLYDFIVSWVCWQLVIAFAAIAWWIYAWGWRAVPRDAVKAPKQLPDGTWRETPESERIDIGFDPQLIPAYEAPVTYSDDGVDHDIEDELEDSDEEEFEPPAADDDLEAMEAADLAERGRP